MAKTRKQILAEFLIHSPNASAYDVINLSQAENLGVQVKTLDSEGNFVLKFSASDPWIKSSEWLHNYKVAIKQRYDESFQVYHSLFPPVQSDINEKERTLGSERVFGSSQMNDLLYESNAYDDGERICYPARLSGLNDILDDVATRYGGKHFTNAYLMALGLAVTRDFVVDSAFERVLRDKFNEKGKHLDQ